MAEITLNNINFSNVNTTNSAVGFGLKNTRSEFVENNKYSVNAFNEINEIVKSGDAQWSEFAFMNAVDIDWNGAQVCGKH